MKKKGMFVLSALIGTLCLSMGASPVMTAVYAAEEEQSTNDLETETETELPDSYYLPIESNEVKGWPQGPQIEAEAAVVMDAETGAFLYGKNMTAKEYPASITKIMTALIAIENGDLDKKLKCSENAVFSIESGSSHCGLQPGEKLTLRQALYALMLESANDAANSIAEKVGGSIDNFVDMMNAKAKELGCVNTHFKNAHGLHNKKHYTCAYDMALITKAAFSNPTFAEIASTINYSIPETNKVKEVRYFVNHHKMLSSEEFRYEGCLGGKTGFTSDALNTLVTVSKRDDTQLICVILRENGAEKSYKETASLLDYGYNNFIKGEEQISDASISIADLLNVKMSGRTRLLTPSVLSQGIVDVSAKIKVSLPKETGADCVTAKYAADGTMKYLYNGWDVGAVRMAFKSPLTKIPKPEPVKTVYHLMDQKVESSNQKQSEAENKPEGFLAHVKYYASEAGETISHYWNLAVDWVYDHDAVLAVVVLILIIALLPVLVIAYVRNRSSQVIRRQRKKEREERVRREEEIENKSALEIEAEIRMELEKEQEKRREEEARKEERRRQMEIEEAKIAEAEKVIQEMQQNGGGKPEDTVEDKGAQEGEESV